MSGTGSTTGDLLPGQSSIDAPANSPELIIARSFQAPRELVWRCYTDPVHLVHFWGPKGATNPVSEVDLRVGGRWRQVMRFATNDYGYTSAYLEISPPEKLVWRDAPEHYQFGDPLPPATMVTTLTLAEAGGITTIRVHVLFDSVAARDEAVLRGFAATVSEGSDKLDLLLQTLQQE